MFGLRLGLSVPATENIGHGDNYMVPVTFYIIMSLDCTDKEKKARFVGDPALLFIFLKAPRLSIASSVGDPALPPC